MRISSNIFANHEEAFWRAASPHGRTQKHFRTSRVIIVVTNDAEPNPFLIAFRISSSYIFVRRGNSYLLLKGWKCDDNCSFASFYPHFWENILDPCGRESPSYISPWNLIFTCLHVGPLLRHCWRVCFHFFKIAQCLFTFIVSRSAHWIESPTK